MYVAYFFEHHSTYIAHVWHGTGGVRHKQYSFIIPRQPGHKAYFYSSHTHRTSGTCNISVRIHVSYDCCVLYVVHDVWYTQTEFENSILNRTLGKDASGSESQNNFKSPLSSNERSTILLLCSCVLPQNTRRPIICAHTCFVDHFSAQRRHMAMLIFIWQAAHSKTSL